MVSKNNLLSPYCFQTERIKLIKFERKSALKKNKIIMKIKNIIKIGGTAEKFALIYTSILGFFELLKIEKRKE